MGEVFKGFIFLVHFSAGTYNSVSVFVREVCFNLVATDISSDSVKTCKDRYDSRKMMERSGQQAFGAEFIQADCCKVAITLFFSVHFCYHFYFLTRKDSVIYIRMRLDGFISLVVNFLCTTHLKRMRKPKLCYRMPVRTSEGMVFSLVPQWIRMSSC